MNTDNPSSAIGTGTDEEQMTKTRALEGLNEAIGRCQLAGIDLGVMELWNSRGRWALAFGPDVEWDEGQGFSPSNTVGIATERRRGGEEE